MKRLALALSLFLSACASRDSISFVPSSSEQALVQWQRPKASLIGEAVFARSAGGDALVRLYKGTPRSLLVLSLDARGTLQASGPLSGFGWKGSVASPPLPLLTWARLMEIYRTASSWPDGTREIQGNGTRALLVITHQRLKVLAVFNDLSGERITVRFN